MKLRPSTVIVGQNYSDKKMPEHVAFFGNTEEKPALLDLRTV